MPVPNDFDEETKMLRARVAELEDMLRRIGHMAVGQTAPSVSTPPTDQPHGSQPAEGTEPERVPNDADRPSDSGESVPFLSAFYEAPRTSEVLPCRYPEEHAKFPSMMAHHYTCGCREPRTNKALAEARAEADQIRRELRLDEAWVPCGLCNGSGRLIHIDNGPRPNEALVRCWRCKHEVPAETTVCNAGIGTQCKDSKACRGRWYASPPQANEASPLDLLRTNLGGEPVHRPTAAPPKADPLTPPERTCDICECRPATICSGCHEEAVDHYIDDKDRAHCLRCSRVECAGMPRSETALPHPHQMAEWLDIYAEDAVMFSESEADAMNAVSALFRGWVDSKMAPETGGEGT